MREIKEARPKVSAQSSQALFVTVPAIEAGCRPAPARVKTKEAVA